MEFGDCAELKHQFEIYEELLKSFSKSKKSDGGVRLLELDGWYRNELPPVLMSRGNVTVAELTNVTEWKMLRGHWRPRNKQLVAGNAEADVADCSRRAFAAVSAGNLRDALDILSKLKGVGPATSSAVLAAYDKTGKAFFMADEVIAATPGVPAGTYTAKAYMQISEWLQKRCDELNAACTCGVRCVWTPSKLERIVWCKTVAPKLPTPSSEASKKASATPPTARSDAAAPDTSSTPETKTPAAKKAKRS
eukprot:TRINITY_DN31731_c0_g1_i1.p2 TRINITY_DN31731_c0_g1~~TRINITY_DN31731_c0_g1_i1.p2  ORF type:complete len:257 (+),score=52.87 TRINITY_DN31731_c0_g1_i1:23-772(+)